jgi:mRNA-degrading endonuclease toxin of MazEF toxin-antitoxin module
MPVPQRVDQGEIWWLEPDPLDTIGSEQEKDRPWVMISTPRLNRGNCVVGLPLSTQLDKACAHLIMIPGNQITREDGTEGQNCVALTDQIRALDKTRFRKKDGFISVRAINAILLGLDFLFGKKPPPIKSAN